MLLRTMIVFMLTSILGFMAITRPYIVVDVNYEMLKELNNFSENLEIKKNTVSKVKAKVKDKVDALPDRDKFLKEVNKLATDLEVSPALLLIKFYIESRINPTAKNKDSGASGIFQLMPQYMPDGMSAAEFRKLSATQQLKHYRDYIMQYKKYIRPGHIEDLYVANLCPRALINGHETLYAKPSKEYYQNKGLDINNDGKITRKDIRKIIESLLENE